MTWQRTTLDDIALSIRNGLFARRPTDNPSGSRILRISAVRGGRVTLDDSRFVEGLEPAQIEKFSVNAGDLLITRYNGSRALVGISGIVPAHDGPVIHPDKLIRVVLDRNRADARFVNYQLQSTPVRSHLEPRIRTTAGQSGIAGADVRSIPLDLPLLDEQHRIVDLLEDHLSRLDAANNYLNAAAGRLDALRLSALQDMSRALRHDGAPVRRIADVADSSLGKMLDAKRAAGSPTPYLRNINVRWGHFDLEDVSTVPLTDDERSRLALHEGDVLVCEGGEPGRCAIWHQERAPMAFQKALHRIRVKPGLITPEFLALSLESFIRSGSADRLFTGTTIKHLPQEKLREIAFPVPSLESQAAAVARLTALEESRSEALRQSWRMTERATTLRRTLLTAAFSGRLTGRSSDLDLAEEMARA